MTIQQLDASEHLRADLIETVFALQRDIFLTLRRRAMPSWMELELTTAQLKTLFVVAHRGPLTVNALAEALSVTQPTVSHLVDRLESSALVKREADAGDRRRTVVCLTPSGADLIETLQQGRREAYRDLIQHLDLADLAALVRGLSAIVRTARVSSSTAQETTEEA